MKRKLSNQFLSSYLIVFLLSLFATALAFVLISVASGLVEKNLAKNRYPASAIIQEDYTRIDSSTVVANGGGVQVVDKNFRVVYTNGVDTINKSQLSAEEFTMFLTESSGKIYHYDILYQPVGEFWLIVTFPVSLRLDFSLIYNPDGGSSDFAQVSRVLAVVAIIYLAILALITFVFSRITAAGIITPLRKLADGTRLLREGDYSARVDLRLKNEFAELQDTFNDMAVRIERERSLRKKSENDRRRLILDISHDLKNPLSSIQGYAELCMQTPDLPTQERERYLQVIHQNSHRANLLLTDLFELSQMDTPEFSIRPVKTDLNEYLRRICGDLVHPFERAGFLYEFDIPEESTFALLDTDRFSRIFQNLSDNALRYNSKGTLLTLRLTVENMRAVICFSDNGSGIPAHLIEDIFNPFVRVEDSRNSQTGGSGLGLAIAKKIAQAHGGDLSLHSGLNKGCTFIITIPTI